MSASGFAARYAGAINWFPGHMAKASAELAARVRDCDVIIEVRDARVPFSSANPIIDSLTSSRPRVIVFNKADLANPQLQSRVASIIRDNGGHEAIFTNAVQGAHVGKVLATVDKLQAKHQSATRAQFKTTGAVMLVVGLPNTGKSTLINAIRGASKFTAKKGAKTGAQPGVTRSVSLMQVRASPPLFLADSPGIMIPRIDDLDTGMRLLVTQAVREAAAPLAAQAEWLHSYFCAVGSDRYVSALGLKQRYEAGDGPALLHDLALKLGATKAQGQLDLEAAARYFVKAFQGGDMGRFTLDYVPLASSSASSSASSEIKSGDAFIAPSSDARAAAASIAAQGLR